jgi:hypothetical protein
MIQIADRFKLMHIYFIDQTLQQSATIDSIAETNRRQQRGNDGSGRAVDAIKYLKRNPSNCVNLMDCGIYTATSFDI